MAILIQHKLPRSAPKIAPRDLSPARAIKAMVLVLVLFSASFRAATAQPVSREYPLKAAFLLNFAQLTTWPTNCFANTNSSLVIGILGNDPFGAALDETLRGETWNDHPFVVRRGISAEDTANCHILFVSQSEAKKLPALAARLKRQPILTVGDFENSEIRNIMIRMFTEKNRIRFQVNLDLLKDSNLNVSSKLLRVAAIESVEAK